MENTLWQHILRVRNNVPLVHNITNYVVMNTTANALLAVGASPIMAHAQSEVKDMAAMADALVINIGTVDEYWEEAMLLAAETANGLQKPWVLDPVGAGATPYRDQVLSRLLSLDPPVIRGNASEIIALAKANTTVTKGADSTATSNEAVEAAQFLADRHNAVVCISGETDLIISKNRKISLKNGHPMMTRVTGLGCTASATIGAFLGITENKTEAVAAAMSLLSIAGELAAEQSNGPGSLQVNILDKLYSITEEEFSDRLKLLIYEG